MTKPPETHIAPSAAAARHGGHRLLSPARYRHPGDMIRLIIAGLVLAVALAVTAVTHATYAGASAVAVSAVAPLEAALVSLLTGVGIEAGPAFSAVLLYRLATYWLHVAPGWLPWRVLQRREYV